MMTSYTVGELFTGLELTAARQLYLDSPPGSFCDNVVNVVLTPNVMARINAKTGQENNARYLGYMLEHLFNQQR